MTDQQAPGQISILCIAEEFPWPPVTGYRVRLANVLHALSEIGEVDFFSVIADDRAIATCVVPDGLSLGRARVVRVRRKKSRVLRFGRWSISRLPRTLLARRWLRARKELHRWARPHYDLVWFSHVDGYIGLRGRNGI